MLPHDDILRRIKDRSPLVHHLTNDVTMEGCADITRAVGAFPVMAHAVEELPEMVGMASAVVINIGTVTREFAEAMVVAAREATNRRIPIILDAVGAGATRFRTELCFRLLAENKISILKGNRSEIAALMGETAVTHGVEAGEVHRSLDEVALEAARRHNVIVVITGPADYVADENHVELVVSGHPLMGEVVGSGCFFSSILGCFSAVENDYFKSAIMACWFYGECGARAAGLSKGPGSFKVRMLDVIAQERERVNG